MVFRKSSDSGFSIVQVLVVIGIMGIVGAGISTMLVNMMNVVHTGESKMGQQILIADLRAVLAAPNTCTATLRTTEGFIVGPNPVPMSFEVSPSIFARGGEDLASTYSVNVTSLQLTGIVDTGQTVGLNRILLGDLVLSTQYSKGSFKEAAPKTVGKIFVTVDPSDRAVSCGLESILSQKPSQQCTLRQNTHVDSSTCMSSVSCLADEKVMSGGCTNTGCSVSINQPRPNGWQCGGWQDWTRGVHYNVFSSTAYALCCR